MKKVKDWIVDRWLTWRTGKDAQTRAWDKWREETIVYRASTVKQYFRNFKYVLALDYSKVYSDYHPFAGDLLDAGFRQYIYPNRSLGDNTVTHVFRGFTSKYDDDFYINDLGNIDQLYAATNNKRDAMMIALKYGG